MCIDAPAEARRGNHGAPLPKPDHEPVPALELGDVGVEPRTAVRIDSSPSEIGSEDERGRPRMRQPAEGLPQERLPPREGYLYPHTFPRQTSAESKKSGTYSSELSENDMTRTQILAKLEASSPGVIIVIVIVIVIVYNSNNNSIIVDNRPTRTTRSYTPSLPTRL